jgi:hypothetical protein
MTAGTNVFDANLELPRSSLSSKIISTTLRSLSMIRFQIMIRISAGSWQNCVKVIGFGFAGRRLPVVWWMRGGEPFE